MSNPLSLTLAADFRQDGVDLSNDQVWELGLGGGDPSALAARTTYGLRARSMRIFPSFKMGRRIITNPSEFDSPPRLRRFTPSLLHLEYAPFTGLEVIAEYWVPSSQTLAGRLTITNRSSDPQAMQFDLCSLLSPINGQSLAAIEMQSVHVLAGRTSNLAPVIFLTGGPLPGAGPYPSLMIDLNLAAGASRQLTWVHAALEEPQASFDLARRTAARPWDAECTRLEFLHASQTIDIQTGDPDWDAAFALSQRLAFSLFYPASDDLPYPRAVQSRSPDKGYLPPGKWLGRTPLADGQSALEGYYFANLLPNTPGLMENVVRNFTTNQDVEGYIHDRPGLAGQQARWISPPLLAIQAWKVYESRKDVNFIEYVFPRLLSYFQVWLDATHDRDRDGFPEWDHPLQAGLEDHPVFDLWHAWGQGADISFFESPALAAMLYSDCRALIQMANLIDDPVQSERLEQIAESLRNEVEACWDADAAIYRMRDRDTHYRPAWQLLGTQTGNGKLELKQAFRFPRRLLVHLHIQDPSCHPKIILRGRAGGKPAREELTRSSMHWGTGWAAYTCHNCYTRLARVDVKGVGPQDKVTVSVLGFNIEDRSLLMPLWAGIPHPRRAQTMVSRSLMNPERFYNPYGISAYPTTDLGDWFPHTAEAEAVWMGVHMPWCHLLGEGLLAYGLRNEAADLITKLMAGIIQNLKKRHAFYSSYHAESGAGMGEQNAVSGLAPLGLFLETLGVRFLNDESVRLEGPNPFPWPVTIQYKGFHITRHANDTEIECPDGQMVVVEDPEPCIVSIRLEE
jgi:hypothetical protein